MTRIAALAAIVAGIVLIVVTFSLSLFPRAYAGERVSDNFRPVMSPSCVVQQKAALDLVGGFVTGYSKQAAPVFARELHMSQPEYERFVAANYPAVTVGAKQIPAAAAAVVGPVVAQAPKLQPKYHEATHIPGLGLPIAAAPWILVLVGTLLAVVGVVGVVRPKPAAAATLLGLGLAMVVAPLALNLPAKASDSGAVLKLGRVAVSQATATAAHTTALNVDDMVSTMRFQMLPDLAARLHTTPTALYASIARDAPGMATGLREWPAVAPAAYALTFAQQAVVEDFKTIDEIGYSGLPWLAIGPGIALTLLAGAALWADRGRRPVPGLSETSASSA
jgi:hypothetical protein